MPPMTRTRRGRPGRPKKQLDPAAVPAPIEQHWTLQQIGAWLQLTPAALIECIKRGELKARKLGAKEWRVADPDLRTWLDKSRVNPSLEAV